VSELDVCGDWVKEYTDQTATMIMIGIAIFSHLLNPWRFLAAGAFTCALALPFLDAIHVQPEVRSNES
jgi:hypothetical protein